MLKSHHSPNTPHNRFETSVTDVISEDKAILGDGGTLTQHDWCPYKKHMFGQRQKEGALHEKLKAGVSRGKGNDCQQAPSSREEVLLQASHLLTAP